VLQRDIEILMRCAKLHMILPLELLKKEKINNTIKPKNTIEMEEINDTKEIVFDDELWELLAGITRSEIQKIISQV